MQVSRQYYFLGSFICMLIQRAGDCEYCESLAGFCKWLASRFLVLLCFLTGAGRGFSAGDDHGGGLSQLHQVPHVCLQFPHLCKSFSSPSQRHFIWLSLKLVSVQLI